LVAAPDAKGLWFVCRIRKTGDQRLYAAGKASWVIGKNQGADLPHAGFLALREFFFCRKEKFAITQSFRVIVLLNCATAKIRTPDLQFLAVKPADGTFDGLR